MIYDGIIDGKTVYLRSTTMYDLEFTYEIRQDWERTKYMHAVTGGLEAQKQWLESQMADPDDYFLEEPKIPCQWAGYDHVYGKLAHVLCGQCFDRYGCCCCGDNNFFSAIPTGYRTIDENNRK